VGVSISRQHVVIVRQGGRRIKARRPGFRFGARAPCRFHSNFPAVDPIHAGDAPRNDRQAPLPRYWPRTFVVGRIHFSARTRQCCASERPAELRPRGVEAPQRSHDPEPSGYSQAKCPQRSRGPISWRTQSVAGGGHPRTRLSLRKIEPSADESPPERIPGEGASGQGPK